MAAATWRARAAAHRDRVAAWTAPHRDRRRRGEPHPVWDFLFTYYSHRPAQLERWDPGPGVVLTGDGAAAFLDRPGYRRTGDGAGSGVVFDPAVAPQRLRTTAAFAHRLLTATRSRAPQLGCFGLHEWAMVYRTDRPRHGGTVGLRLGGAGTDAVVESLRISCSHYDAYRFFTEAAAPRNALTPTRETQAELEQPGCLHATMDLYKWAYKLAPAAPSELVADCFALAADVRELDMRAGPYDLAGYGFTPVRIETPQGRADYARAQAGFAERAAPLRDRLIALAEQLTG
ncbi:3-methyladenine DNA glycosylase [Pseudonocardia sp. C8]|uniref:3-methyladenine DNA glycosylase n=1 Tax=Pseudonocardia sp. C8 TaxID=2762759 RepID=UPI001642719D|nr:3-methyladenine DNA glycosylase [Pseudonocardia sp. C8]MBC3191996.1 3-methyladenine DNA glycosylase [Pseudonocardia sp. C8]